jgi:hypothetical protein
MPPRKRADAGLRELPDYPNPKPKSTKASKKGRRPHLVPAAEPSANFELAQYPGEQTSSQCYIDQLSPPHYRNFVPRYAKANFDGTHELDRVSSTVPLQGASVDI